MGGAAGRAPGPCPVISPALPCDPAECPEAKEKERKDAPNGVLSATETYVACVEATGEDSSLGLAGGFGRELQYSQSSEGPTEASGSKGSEQLQSQNHSGSRPATLDIRLVRECV